ncbi:TonB-dependent receptor [Mucilaginibacter sp. Bleaf8]|nr:TonB-dependent receptor [Mucilaginibacter sp. Bleaf8]MBS7566653.1 TonB-dependent receptor [Mucilaginibacter sp. Bleaf8]
MLLPFVAAAQFSVSGKVIDQQTGQPLPGATLVLKSLQLAPSTVTNGTGNYQFSNIKAGSYVLTVSYIGYQTAQKAFNLNGNLTVNLQIANATTQVEEVTVSATRASANSPTAFTNLRRKDIQKNNLGQDLPFLLNQTPSVVTTSDAGAGVGYTGIRIRGSDGTRTNVTINGIPYNDAESQGSFYVNLPDFASSVDNIQIQRGVGTSTNGAGAFGASINIQTTTRRDSAYAELNNAAGSYGTVKNTVQLGTGLLGGKFTFDGRLSRISSDGYIDMASSNLQSYFLSGAYYGKTNVIRANVFAGHERTYQAWNGIPDYVIGNKAYADSIGENPRRYNELGIMPNGDRYRNQVDDYTQKHYQLLYDQTISRSLSFSGALHYTRGYGYYEEYQDNDDLAGTYGIKPVTIGGVKITNTNLVRRRWLDNNFYGVTYSLKYRTDDKFNFILGGAYNKYDGDHIGNVLYTEQSAGILPNYEYYRNNGKKNDFNIFGRAEYKVGDVLLYGDLQYRRVNYNIQGIENKMQLINNRATFNFFNPKVGFTYLIDDHNNVYASFAVGNREPNRNDYTDRAAGQPEPKSENLKDFEVGYRINQSNFSGSINGFYMLYKNQLVLTGQLNDVGTQIRTNVKDSYRAGIEAEGRVRITRQLSWGANATVSTNKVKNFTQALDNYNADFEKIDPVVQTLAKSNLAFSPSFIAGSELSFAPVKNGSIALLSKYVSKQYLDNTSNTNPQGITTSPDVANNPYAVNRYLKSYFVNDLRLNYNFSVKGVKNIGVTLLVNNLFSKKYEANGATYPDVEAGHIINYNYFFPQAPRNFLASVNLRF